MLGRVDPFRPSAFFLITSRCEPWQSPGSLLWFRLLHRELLGALLCAALSLAHERPRRLVIGHVLLGGHARNGAADHVESQVLQRFEADATITHVELLAALLVFA